MKMKWIFSLFAIAVLSGCETLQSPQQRRATQTRNDAAVRYTEERIIRLQDRMDSLSQENARLNKEVQQLREDVRNYNQGISQLNSSMDALEVKQVREMTQTIAEVEKMLKKMGSQTTPAPGNRGPGRTHVVERGHTLSAIAVAYKTTVSAIKKANNLTSDEIYVGQKLFIPE